MRQKTDIALVIAELQEEIDCLVATCLRQQHVLDTLLRELKVLQTEFSGAPDERPQTLDFHGHRAEGDPEQKLEELHSRLADQIAQLTSGADWQAWLKVAARFHAYSFSNTLLILAQRPDATQVAGYRVAVTRTSGRKG
jgi:hypothetical protein